MTTSFEHKALSMHWWKEISAFVTLNKLSEDLQRLSKVCMEMECTTDWSCFLFFDMLLLHCRNMAKHPSFRSESESDISTSCITKCFDNVTNQSYQNQLVLNNHSIIYYILSIMLHDTSNTFCAYFIVLSALTKHLWFQWRIIIILRYIQCQQRASLCGPLYWK